MWPDPGPAAPPYIRSSPSPRARHLQIRPSGRCGLTVRPLWSDHPAVVVQRSGRCGLTVRPLWFNGPAVGAPLALGADGALSAEQRRESSVQTGRMVGPEWPDGRARVAGWWGQTGRMVGPEWPDGRARVAGWSGQSGRMVGQTGRMVGPDRPDGGARPAGWSGQTGRMVRGGGRRWGGGRGPWPGDAAAGHGWRAA